MSEEEEDGGKFHVETAVGVLPRVVQTGKSKSERRKSRSPRVRDAEKPYFLARLGGRNLRTREGAERGVRQTEPAGCSKLKPVLRLGLLHVVLLELAVESSFADAEHARSREFVAACFAEGAENRAALQFLERQDFIFVGRAFARRILQTRRQIRHMEDGTRTQRNGAFNGVLQFTHISGPVISDQSPHGFFGNGSNGSLGVGKFLEKSGG